MSRIIVAVVAATTVILVASNALTGDPQAADPPTTQPLSKLAAERAEKLKAGVANFSLQLNYRGPQDKPFYHLCLRVRAADVKAAPFHESAQITEAQAKAIIDYLAADGFFDHAEDSRNRDATPKPPAGPTYSLGVMTSAAAYDAWIGWDLRMLHRLDGLRKLLDGDAAKSMDLLLGRLSGYRKLWDPASSQPDGHAARAMGDLIRQLGADTFREREEATGKLIAMGASANDLLKARLKEPDLDPEVASRIKTVLSKTADTTTAADKASGITVHISEVPEGARNVVTASRNGSTLWKSFYRGEPSTSVTIEGGQVIVQPRQVVIDLQTGRILSIGGRD